MMTSDLSVFSLILETLPIGTVTTMVMRRRRARSSRLVAVRSYRRSQRRRRAPLTQRTAAPLSATSAYESSVNECLIGCTAI